LIRLFVPDPLAADARVAPSPEQARYLTQVMRLSVGDPLLLFNGRDGEWRASVAEIAKRGCVLAVHERTREQAGVPDLELLVALVKRNRLETIVEKAAELGCRRVRLVITRRTQADHTNVARLQAIATEAAEQTGRLDVPEVVAPEKLDRLLVRWDAGRRLMFCDEGPGFVPPLYGEGQAGEAGQGGDVAPFVPHPALRATLPIKGREKNEPWAVLIGPEGGFAPEERARLRAAPFVTPVTLGPRVLRADTAAISALTLWQAARGDWRA
jgi:16S rRNA (uracil1498-N3)-methyltransferase